MSRSPAFASATPISTSLNQNALRTICPARPSRTYTAPRMAFSSIDRVLTADPVSTPNPASDVIAAVYNQVLGNAYLMESEREELAKAESDFCFTSNVRSFVRAVALSDAYKSRFFDPVSQYRFIELAFKHLLGRAPASKQEYASAMAVYHSKGFAACINWFIDSDEYTAMFGDYIVPYGVYMGCYPTNEQFNRSVSMRLTPSSSDKGRKAMLQYCVCSGDSPSWLSIAKALPAGTEKGTGFVIGGHWQSTQRNKNAPVRVGTKIPGGVVFY